MNPAPRVTVEWVVLYRCRRGRTWRIWSYAPSERGAVRVRDAQNEIAAALRTGNTFRAAKRTTTVVEEVVCG